MRRNLKPAHTESRTPRASGSRARRTSASDFLEPMGNPETLWGEDANEEQRSDSDKEEADGDPDALDGESGAPAEEKEKDGDVVSGPDDALGLYLRQMGAIPLLSRARQGDPLGPLRERRSGDRVRADLYIESCRPRDDREGFGGSRNLGDQSADVTTLLRWREHEKRADCKNDHDQHHDEDEELAHRCYDPS